MNSGRIEYSGKMSYATFLRELTFRLADLAAILFGVFVAHWWRFGTLQMLDRYWVVLVIALLLVLLIFPAFGLYQPARVRTLYTQIRGLLLASALVGVMLTLIAFLTKTGSMFSRQWFIASGLFTMLFLISLRVLATAALRFLMSRVASQVRVAIIGAGTLGRRVVERLAELHWADYAIEALYDDAPRLAGGNYVQAPIRPMQELVQDVEKNSFDELWFTLPLRSEERLRTLIHELRHAPITFRLVPNIFEYRLLNHSVEMLCGIPIVTLNCTPMVGFNRFVKFCEDKLLAALFLLLASPAMLVISLAIKATSRGPVLFKQIRYGWGGRPISVWKFRTMIVHEEQEGRVTQASRKDTRITPVGRFLRRTSLDELPQLINVLQGSMSIVGPRPHAVAHNEEYKDIVEDYMGRHKVKPGITGWAQINGYRGETDTVYKMEKRVEYDLYYIRNWSLWFDMKIIGYTFFKGFLNENAY